MQATLPHLFCLAACWVKGAQTRHASNPVQLSIHLFFGVPALVMMEVHVWGLSPHLFAAASQSVQSVATHAPPCREHPPCPSKRASPLPGIQSTGLLSVARQDLHRISWQPLVPEARAERLNLLWVCFAGLHARSTNHAHVNGCIKQGKEAACGMQPLKL